MTPSTSKTWPDKGNSLVPITFLEPIHAVFFPEISIKKLTFSKTDYDTSNFSVHQIFLGLRES